MRVIVNPVGYLVPQQVTPAPATPVEGGGEQCLADEVKQSAYGVDRQQNAENLQNRQWLLVQVLQIEQLAPEQFPGGRVVGDQVHGERGLRYPVDGSIVEGDAVEQQEHAEADHDDGQPPTTGDVYSHVVPEQRQCYGGAGAQQEKTETCANHQPDLSGGERFHVPLISRKQNEQVDESEEAVVDFHHSGDEAGQSPHDQHGRGQRQVVFASERLQSLGKEGEQRQENGVGGGVPPQTHAQRHDALHHEFHAKVGPVEHEVERYEDKAPEQELAFHDPYAFQVGFDGLLPVEEEPCGDGEEDDHADLAAAGHDKLEEDPLRPQGEIQHVVAVVNDEVVHEDHEHRDDAQQFDAGIPLPPFEFLECAGTPCLACAPPVFVLWLFSFIVLLLYRHHPLAIPPTHQGLRRQEDPRGQGQARDHPLCQTVHRL